MAKRIGKATEQTEQKGAKAPVVDLAKAANAASAALMPGMDLLALLDAAGQTAMPRGSAAGNAARIGPNFPLGCEINGDTITATGAYMQIRVTADSVSYQRSRFVLDRIARHGAVGRVACPLGGNPKAEGHTGEALPTPGMCRAYADMWRMVHAATVAEFGADSTSAQMLSKLAGIASKGNPAALLASIRAIWRDEN